MQPLKLLGLIPNTGAYSGYVNRVIDGDTIEVCFLTPIYLRLHGLNAAALSTPRGKDAALWLQRQVEGRMVEMELMGPYKFGAKERELVGRVLVDGTDVGAQEILLGKADPWNDHGPRPGG